ncbi:ParB/RepB/Spo0J family partition protein [uncultured Algimonas sp.]|uniref:ParB/RepB/Spo0J family partition protein n=1 Tax=uncultured Algimonas sp. TaxID=1547920 RepID=UPI00261879B3|nr:ParB/RepB/Spo0J family partition protein [uncultured Algimonas sp.]
MHFDTVRDRTNQRAPLERFTLIRAKLLTGPLLHDIRTLRHSIERVGLLSPIVVIPRNGLFVAVDGRKRLAALRGLAFEGRLPDALRTLPYRTLDRRRGGNASYAPLPFDEILFRKVLNHSKTGLDVETIMAKLGISRQTVGDIMSLSRLTGELRGAMFARIIDFDQAYAFAALPTCRRQQEAFERLGPRARPEDILSEG